MSLQEEHAPELAALDNELTNARLKAAPFRNRLAEIEGTANIKKSELQVFNNKATEIQSEAEELQEQLNTSNADLKDKSKEIKDLQKEITAQE